MSVLADRISSNSPTKTKKTNYHPLAGSHMRSVFHVTEETRVQAAVNGAINLQMDKSVEIAEVVIVANGGAVRGFMKNGRMEEHSLKALNHGIMIRVCDNSLLGLRIDRSRLLEGVEIVKSGVGELTRLQSQGFAYIRI